MRGLDLPPKVLAASAAGALVLLASVGGLGLWLHARPVLHLASSAQECLNAPDHLATLFSDDQNTLIRVSNLDYSNLRVLRVEPAASLPGMFDSLLALSSDSRRLAYVTASDELMDDARIQYLDVASPDPPHVMVQLPTGLAPVRPAWSPGEDQLAYVVGHPASGSKSAGFEVWSVRADASLPAQKVSELPLDVFARGHSASLCWTPGGQIGLLQGVESAAGQPGPSPLTGAGAASAARTETPTPTPGSPARGGSPCGVPVFSQNDPSWQSTIMQLGGDPIGGFGCALTSTTMLLNYYGAILSPVQLNSCLGSGADPIIWQSAPACTAGKVQGGERTDFSWEGVDAFLKAGKPVIVGMVRGLTGMHFVVVTQGGGGQADNYSITDPWDGSTTKTLGSYMSTGYNPRWIVSYDGPGKNCGRLVPSSGPSVHGFSDGGTYRNSVTVTSSGGSTTVQQVPSGKPGPSTPTPTPAGTPTATPTPTPTPTATSSATPKTTPSGGPNIIHLYPPSKIVVTNEGHYEVIVCEQLTNGRPRCHIHTFTIDRTPPVLSIKPLNLHLGAIHTLFAFRPYADASSIVLDRPGMLRLAAVDTLSGVDSIEYQLDGSDWNAYSDDVSFVRTLVVPTVGTHTISIRARDLARNVGEVDGLTFDVVDSTPSPSPSASPTPTPTATPTAGPTRRPTNAPPPPPPTPAPTPAPTPIPIAITISPVMSDPPPTFVLACGRFYAVFASITTSAATSVTYGWLHTVSGKTTLTNQQTISIPAGTPTQVVEQVAPPVGTPVTIQLEVVAPHTVISPNSITLTCYHLT